MKKFIFTPLFLVVTLCFTFNINSSIAQSTLLLRSSSVVQHSFTTKDMVKSLLKQSVQTTQNRSFTFVQQHNSYLTVNHDFSYKLPSNTSKFSFYASAFVSNGINGLVTAGNNTFNLGAVGAGFGGFNNFIDCTTPAFFNTGNNNGSLNVYYGNGGSANTPILDSYYNGNTRTTSTNNNGGNVRIQSRGANSYSPNNFIGIKN